MKKNISEKEVETLLNKYRLENSENNFHRLPLQIEKRALRLVREGRYQDMHFAEYTSFKNNLGLTAKNSKRSFEYNTVAAITLFCRAAIEGGVMPEEALNLSDVLLQEVEKAENVEELYSLYQTAEILFAKLVSKTRRRHSSYQVEQCRAYVANNIFRRITVKEIAEQIGLTPNYLSRLFRSEEGIGLNDYIQKEKTALASNLLSQSEQSISSIALYLGFKSQSHFTEVFKTWQGMTPSEYRNMHYQTIYT